MTCNVQGLLVSGGNDKIINVWDPSTESPVQVLLGHEGAVSCLAASPDGSIISGSWDKYDLHCTLAIVVHSCSFAELCASGLAVNA